jgi:hypothetical protein
MSLRTEAALLGVAVVVNLSACDTATRPTPAPTPRPPAPQTPTPVPSPPTFTVSGTVFEHTLSGVRPQAGVPIRIRVWGSTIVLRDGISDNAGRYEISGVPERGSLTIAPPDGSDYRAPCPSGSSGALTGDASFDVHVVSAALLSTSGVPASIPRHSVLRFEGAVFERVSDATLPVAGATVDLAGDDSGRWVYATTLTDAKGGYMVCTAPPGVGTDQVHTVVAYKDGYHPASREGFPGFDFINLEIVRR